MLDKFKEECALIGVWGHKEAANIAYLGLYAQQHRGQEGAGLVSLQQSEQPEETQPQFHIYRGLGLVADVFNNFDFSRLPGSAAIGHVRYTTAGEHRLANVQPFCAEISLGNVSIAHNGNLVNAEQMRSKLISEGAIFATTSDSEVILHLLANAPKNVRRVEAVISALQQVEGAFSLLLLFDDRLYAVRDPRGFRPLCYGTLNGGYVFASESCALDLVNAEYVRELKPGEIVEVAKGGEIRSYFPFGVAEESPCIFEYIYFSRPDSIVFGRNVYPLRKNLGRELAREHPVPADVVIPVPDSGVPAALGYAQEVGLPFEYGLIRNHYVGRTFIEPQQSIRDFGVKVKLNPNADVLRGKRVVVVDDSIVRGTTSRKLVSMLRQAGAKEIHMRISAPPTTDPCYYGIDTPEKKNLIAAQKSVEEITEYLEVDSLAYLSREGMYRAVGGKEGKFCDACFTGRYPVISSSSGKSRQASLFDFKSD